MFHFTLVSSSRNDSSVDIEVGGNKGRGKKVERQDFFISLESDTNLLVIRLLLVNGGLGNSVKITLAGLGDAAATLVLVLLEDTDLLKGLEDLALDSTGGVNVVGGAGTTVLGRAVDLTQAANTDGLAEVDVTGDGGSADVVPVGVLGRKFVGGGGLDSVNPT